MESIRSFKNPLRFILNSTILIFTVLLIFYIGVRIYLTSELQSKDADLLVSIAEDLKTISIYIFGFIRPFLQLVIVLIILEWLLGRFGISLDKNFKTLEWNVQTIIAIVVIIAFALAALSGVEGASMLKDLALVVVGFYFGTQKKTIEIVQGESKTIETEEHTNDRSNK